MRKFTVGVLLVLCLSFCLPYVAYAKDRDNLPETIETERDLREWCDYLCENGGYGLVGSNYTSNIKTLDCKAFVRLVYEKMGYVIDWYGDVDSYGQKITKLSEARPGDIVIYKNPASGIITHAAILIDPEDGELVQACGKKVGIMSMKGSNPKCFSNLWDMRTYWKAPYTNWNWENEDESAHPDAIYLLRIDEATINPSVPDFPKAVGQIVTSDGKLIRYTYDMLL